MKTLLLITGFLLVGPLGIVMANPELSIEPSPLPPGKLVQVMPNFAQWQVNFTYEKDKKKPAPPPDTPSDIAPSELSASAKKMGLPRKLIITQTKPIWHGVLIDEFSNKTEAWYDGLMPYVVSLEGTMVMYLNTPGATMPSFLDYRGNDFPDVDWVSPQTYLGMQKGTGYWVFQHGADGPLVWIDSSTRYPVRWQSKNETRIFLIQPSPSEPLALPTDVAKLSQQQHFLHKIASHTIPKGG